MKQGKIDSEFENIKDDVYRIVNSSPANKIVKYSKDIISLFTVDEKTSDVEVIMPMGSLYAELSGSKRALKVKYYNKKGEMIGNQGFKTKYLKQVHEILACRFNKRIELYEK